MYRPLLILSYAMRDELDDLYARVATMPLTDQRRLLDELPSYQRRALWVRQFERWRQDAGGLNARQLGILLEWIRLFEEHDLVSQGLDGVSPEIRARFVALKGEAVNEFPPRLLYSIFIHLGHAPERATA